MSDEKEDAAAVATRMMQATASESFDGFAVLVYIPVGADDVGVATQSTSSIPPTREMLAAVFNTCAKLIMNGRRELAGVAINGIFHEAKKEHS